jgi:predicted component of type VI protein secretion system
LRRALRNRAAQRPMRTVRAHRGAPRPEPVPADATVAARCARAGCPGEIRVSAWYSFWMPRFTIHAQGRPPVRVTANGPAITIGRDPAAGVPLDDPEKHVSRLHATVTLVDGAYFLTVHSKLNPVLVDGRVLRSGQTTQINTGTRITMWPFEIDVTLEADMSQTMPAVHAAALASGAPAARAAPAADDPFAVLDALAAIPAPAAAPQADPFLQMAPAPAAPGSALDLLGGVPGAGGGGSALDLLGGAAGPGGMPAPGGVDLPLDPLALLGPSPVPPAGRGAPGSAASLLDPPAAGAGARLDHVHDFNLPFAPPPAPAARPAPSRAEPAALPGDPFADGFDPFADLDIPLTGEPAAAPAPAAESKPAAAPAEPPVRRAAPPVAAAAAGQPFAEADGAPMLEPAPAPPPRSMPPVAAASGQALASFLEGVGVRGVDIPPAAQDAYLREAGQIMRAVVETLMVLLQARSEVKRELRADDRTMLAARDNNPLKMMTDSGDALRYLFDPNERRSGFLAPVQAIEDAANDLRAHELALVAGMRAAVIGAIKRFEPEGFEKVAAKSAGMLKMNMAGKSWETFVEFYRKLDRDMADSIDKVFLRDFLKAYTEQVRRLTRPG